MTTHRYGVGAYGHVNQRRSRCDPCRSERVLGLLVDGMVVAEMGVFEGGVVHCILETAIAPGCIALTFQLGAYRAVIGTAIASERLNE